MVTLTGNPDLANSGFDYPPLNPLSLLQKWLERADQLKIVEPRGLVLSTVNASNQPSSRVVLLKRVDDKGVVFASSTASQKGLDLSKNPGAAGTLWWRETMQQINFYGSATTLPTEVADQLFRERSREAQAATALSHQSEVMMDEEKLREAITKLINQAEPIIRPKSWHAYHVAIETIEFWQGARDRFHKRLRYTLSDGVWNHQKLQP